MSIVPGTDSGIYTGQWRRHRPATLGTCPGSLAKPLDDKCTTMRIVLSTMMSRPLKFDYTKTPSTPTRVDAKTVLGFTKYRYRWLECLRNVYHYCHPNIYGTCTTTIAE